MVELVEDLFGQGVHALQPTVVPARQFQDDLQECQVIFLLLGCAVLVDLLVRIQELSQELLDVVGFTGQFLTQRVRVIHLDDLQQVGELQLSFPAIVEDSLPSDTLAHGIEHLPQHLLDVDIDGVLAKFGDEVVADGDHILEDEDEGVGGVAGIALAVESIGQMFEEPQEVGDALDFGGNLGVVGEFLLGWVLDARCGQLLLLGLVHLTQLVHQLLDQCQVETLGQQFQDLLEHMQERWGELLEIQLQRYEDWFEQMFQFLVVGRQFFGMVLSG